MTHFHSNTYTRFTAVAFQFSCIGNDPRAAQLLIDLEQDPHVREYIDVFLVGSDLERQFPDKWSMVCYNLPFSKLTIFKWKPTVVLLT